MREAYRGGIQTVVFILLAGIEVCLFACPGSAAEGKRAELILPLGPWVGPVKSVGLSGDGKRVLTGSKDKTARLWDAETGKTLQTFKGHTEWVESVALSRDGKRVLTGSGDNTARLWDADTGKTVQSFKGHTSWITSVAFS